MIADSLSQTPLQSFNFANRLVYIKRDDLLHPLFSGNKARKFASLLKQELKSKTLISYGGNQSNALQSLASLSLLKDCNLIYFTTPFSKALLQESEGNFAYALKSGVVEFRETPHPQEESQKYALQNPQALFIPQGGSVELAMEGMRELSEELRKQTGDLKSPIFFYSSGIGTASLTLAQFDLEVYTALGAGKLEDLLQRFSHYPKSPKVLESEFHLPFGKPHTKVWEMYEYWMGQGVEFDLLYDCLLWIKIKENLARFEDREIVFIHSGGLMGNITQEKRYRLKNLC